MPRCLSCLCSVVVVRLSVRLPFHVSGVACVWFVVWFAFVCVWLLCLFVVRLLCLAFVLFAVGLFFVVLLLCVVGCL